MDVRRLATLGLVLAAVGLIVPGFYHVRCVGYISIPAGGASGESTSSCAQTFPSEIVPVAALVGLVGVVLALVAAVRLARASDGRRAARIVLTLATLALLVPTLLPIAGWASAGFELNVATPEGQCSGRSGKTPLWLQTSTCVSALDLVLTPLAALAGVFAAATARRGSARLAVAALGIAVGALVTYVLALAIQRAYLGETWIVPLAGTILLASAFALLHREPAAARTA